MHSSFIETAKKNLRDWNPTSNDCDEIIEEVRVLFNGLITAVDKLSDGYTNVSMQIVANDGTKYKLSIFVEDYSYLSSPQQKIFLSKRGLVYRFYQENLQIVYFDMRKTLSLYIDGECMTPLLKKAGNATETRHYYRKIAEAIDDFHKANKLLPDTQYQDLISLFFCSLTDLDLLKKGQISENDLNRKIMMIKEFESGFENEWFVLSHNDTDPINMVYSFSEDKTYLIDFEFTGRSLVYYDYANCYNVLKNIIGTNSYGLEDYLVAVENIFPQMNRIDFFKSVEVMTFTWGLWYYLYGLRFNDDRLTEIGIEWINELKLEDKNYA